ADLLADDDSVSGPERAVPCPIVDRSLLSRRSTVRNEFIFGPKETQQWILIVLVNQFAFRRDRDVVLDDLFYILEPVAQFSSERPQIGELRLVLRRVLVGLLPDRHEYSNMRIDPVQASQRQPGADLAGMPDTDKAFVDFIPAEIREIDVMNEIFIDV